MEGSSVPAPGKYSDSYSCSEKMTQLQLKILGFRKTVYDSGADCGPGRHPSPGCASDQAMPAVAAPVLAAQNPRLSLSPGPLRRAAAAISATVTAE